MIVRVLKDNNDGTSVVLTMPCVECGQSSNVTVPTQGLIEWIDGKNIQYCFPEMKPKVRETLISGMHSECWDNVFGGEEE